MSGDLEQVIELQIQLIEALRKLRWIEHYLRRVQHDETGCEIEAAEGSARNMDFAGIGAMAAGFGALMGGKSKSPQEKILVAAFMDSYNQMVRATRNYQAQTVRGGLGTGGLMQVDGAKPKM